MVEVGTTCSLGPDSAWHDISFPFLYFFFFFFYAWLGVVHLAHP